MNPSDSYNSSSSASSQFAAYPEYFNDNGERKSSPPSFHSSLHEIRRVPLKPMKKPIAPLPPTRPKVYKVDCMHFKKVVQRLTAAPEFQPTVDQGSEVMDMVEVVPLGPAFRHPRRLQEVAPPALDFSNTSPPLLFSSNDVNNGGCYQFGNRYNGLPPQIPPNFSEIVSSERKFHKLSETCGAQSPLGFNFSPPSMAWCLSPLLSPGTLSILD